MPVALSHYSPQLTCARRSIARCCDRGCDPARVQAGKGERRLGADRRAVTRRRPWRRSVRRPACRWRRPTLAPGVTSTRSVSHSARRMAMSARLVADARLSEDSAERWIGVWEAKARSRRGSVGRAYLFRRGRTVGSGLPVCRRAARPGVTKRWTSTRIAFIS